MTRRVVPDVEDTWPHPIIPPVEAPTHPDHIPDPLDLDDPVIGPDDAP